jgi:GNAT superfamily N-acetyltransferase
MRAEQGPFEIRPARLEDGDRLADLCTQLGYPSTPEEVRNRLAVIGELPDQHILVAVDAAKEVLGWIHAFVYRVLESEPMVEIGGLVVDQAFRGRGVGRALLEAVETWSAAQEIDTVSLRSNVVRMQAHEFYRRQGYTVPKTQLVFRKNLRNL